MNQRNIEIDLTKGILTVGMVFAHTVQFLAENPNKILIFISQLTDLVSFSGFLFCFGFAAWFAYLQSPQRPWLKIIRTVLKFYIAFIISGMAFRVLINASKPELSLLASIAALRDIPAYSEFLLAFATIILLGAIFQKVIVLATQHWQPLLVAIMICLASTFLPNKTPYLPLISQVIGGQGFIAYPAIPYLPLFLLGIFRARHPEPFSLRLYFLAAMAGVLLFMMLILFDIPLTRYPPSAGWVLCSGGIFFFYYWFAHMVHIRFPNFIQKYLNAVGQNVLVYLLLSNLVLFTSHPLGLTKALNTTQTFIFFVLLMGLILFLQFIILDLKRTNESLRQES
jgi:fucose 4-O-acetylase-like acetyltransferase